MVSFDASGALVPGRVTQLLHSITDTWLHLSNGTYVTPGHRYLRPDGSFAEIQDIIADDGRIVAADGSIQTVTAEVIRYSAETAHMFEEAEMLVYASEGGAALAPQVKRGWNTYNFTVAETHTYVADGIRVHNESVLSALKEGDVLLSLDDSLTNAAVLRDVNGDGRDNAIRNEEVLPLHRDYFRLRKPVERRVYELARKHCGQQRTWRISLAKLLLKSGSQSPEKRFRQMIRELVTNDHLPDYHVAYDETADMVIFTNRGTMSPAPPGLTLVSALHAETYESARAAAPGWDVYYLEREWREWIVEPPRDADAAFVGFCRKWFEKRGSPE